jgi:hypothetical protein
MRAVDPIQTVCSARIGPAITTLGPQRISHVRTTALFALGT